MVFSTVQFHHLFHHRDNFGYCCQYDGIKYGLVPSSSLFICFRKTMGFTIGIILAIVVSTMVLSTVQLHLEVCSFVSGRLWASSSGLPWLSLWFSLRVVCLGGSCVEGDRPQDRGATVLGATQGSSPAATQVLPTKTPPNNPKVILLIIKLQQTAYPLFIRCSLQRDWLFSAFV